MSRGNVWNCACVRVRESAIDHNPFPFSFFLASVSPSQIERMLSDAGKRDAPEFWTPHATPYEVRKGKKRT